MTSEENRETVLLIPMGSSVAMSVTEGDLAAVRARTWDRIMPFVPLAWHHVILPVSFTFCVAILLIKVHLFTYVREFGLTAAELFSRFSNDETGSKSCYTTAPYPTPLPPVPPPVTKRRQQAGEHLGLYRPPL